MIRKNIILILSMVLVLTSCSAFSNKPVERQDFHMGTVIQQRVYGQHAAEAAEEVDKRMQQIESKMTINSPGSQVDVLNDMAGVSKVKLDPDIMYVLEKAKKYQQLSNGAFDVTIGPLVKAWGIFTDHPRIPDKNEIDSLLSLVNDKALTLDSEASTAALEQKGQIVDLGGIAKGFAGDEAISIYKKYGIKSAFVNLGGNVATLGSKPDGSPWKIGVQNPRAETGKYIGVLTVTDKTVVSSGDYERYFEKDGVRYHHIIDPKTGYPANSGLIGTTIVTDLSVNADALSTATFILGLDKGMKLIESLDGVEAIFITSDKKVYATSGLKNIFTFSDESKEYEYVEKR